MRVRSATKEWTLLNLHPPSIPSLRPDQLEKGWREDQTRP